MTLLDYKKSIAFIFLLCIVRAFICSNEYQNIIIASINFFGLSYIVWRIYYPLLNELKTRRKSNSVFKKQLVRFKSTFKIGFCLIIEKIPNGMSIYILLQKKSAAMITISIILG